MTPLPQFRFDEVAAMLPILHMPVKNNTAAAIGPQAEQMAAELLKWRDVRTLYLLEAPRHLKDRRIEVVTTLPKNSVDILLLSPEVSPESHLGALTKGGVVNAMTADQEKSGALRAELAQCLGSAVPWREHLPAPLFGVISCNGNKPKRQRPVPNGAKRLSKQYLPCLFVFGKDELPLAFTQHRAKV